VLVVEMGVPTAGLDWQALAKSTMNPRGIRMFGSFDGIFFISIRSL
jgi:hypothetical protein